LDSFSSAAYSQRELDPLQFKRVAQENFRVNKIRLSARRFLPQKLRRPLVRIGAALVLAALAYAQQGGNDPWDNAVNVLKTAFTGPIATGLSLVAIVIGGLMFAFGEGQSKRSTRSAWSRAGES
jgi:type IV secretory pathway VirB2 component (pilin)